MDRLRLIDKLNNNPEEFWHFFMSPPMDFSDEWECLRVIYNSKVDVPLMCRERYKDIIEKAYLLIPCGVTVNEKQMLLLVALKDERDIQSFINIQSYNHYLFALRFGDVTEEIASLIDDISPDILNNMNTKHFREFLGYLQNKGFNYQESVRLSLQIYHVLGYFKGRDFLQNMYGDASKEKIEAIFGNISLRDVVYDLEKKEPILNEIIIMLLIGESYHIKDTPIKRYLAGDRDSNIDFVLSNLNLVLSEWDLIQEEYIKRSNLEGLELKLNVYQIKIILENIIDMKRKIERQESLRGKKKQRWERIPDYEPKDEPLLYSDLFDYIGTYNKYVIYPRMAPYRAVELSRMMKGTQSKKFPQISLEYNGYKLITFHPQNRDILSAGYRTDNCFLPTGSADAHGEGYGLLSYCATTPYGGGIEIRNKDGKALAFCPILRNGNVLMLHSIEGVRLTSEEKDLINTFIEYWILEVFKSNADVADNDKIVAIATAEQGNLVPNKYDVCLPESKKFHIFDPDLNYQNIHSNLHNDNYLLALDNQKSIADIRYDYPIGHDYPYSLDRRYEYVSIPQEVLPLIKKRDEIKKEIQEYTSARRKMLKEHQPVLAMEMLRRIKALEEEKIAIYYGTFSCDNAKRDYYGEFEAAMDGILAIYEKFDAEIDFDIYGLSKIYYDDDWFIGVDTLGNLHYKCLEGLENQFLDILKNVEMQLKGGTVKLKCS